jgi:hypothetical protein
MYINSNTLYSIYSQLTKNCEICKIGDHVVYYKQKEINNPLACKNLIDLDIKSAFPTLCGVLFGKNSTFVKNIENKQTKLEKNIFISNTLKDLEKETGDNYLIQLNYLSKMIILGYIFNKYEEIDIIEYKKDGVLFSGNEVDEKNLDFNFFLEENNIQFKKKEILKYLRFDNTSFYLDEKKEMDVKGKYKEPPIHLNDSILKILNYETDNEFFKDLKKIYSKEYYTILFKTNSFSEIKYYYGFSKGNKFLNNELKFENLNFNINPRIILIQIIYPIVNLLRMM